MVENKPKLRSTTAKAYREKVAGISVIMPSGSVFKVRPLTMPEYSTIIKSLMAKFKNLKPENMMTVGWDIEQLEIMMEYSRLALPLCAMEPRIRATQTEASEDELYVDIIIPTDLIRLNMLTTTASPGVSAMIASFLTEQPTDEESDTVGGLAKEAAK